MKDLGPSHSLTTCAYLCTYVHIYTLTCALLPFPILPVVISYFLVKININCLHYYKCIDSNRILCFLLHIVVVSPRVNTCIYLFAVFLHSLFYFIPKFFFRDVNLLSNFSAYQIIYKFNYFSWSSFSRTLHPPAPLWAGGSLSLLQAVLFFVSLHHHPRNFHFTFCWLPSFLYTVLFFLRLFAILEVQHNLQSIPAKSTWVLKTWDLNRPLFYPNI